MADDPQAIERLAARMGAAEAALVALSRFPGIEPALIHRGLFLLGALGGTCMKAGVEFPTLAVGRDSQGRLLFTYRDEAVPPAWSVGHRLRAAGPVIRTKTLMGVTEQAPVDLWPALDELQAILVAARDGPRSG